MLSTVLTTTSLRALAGPAYGKGEAYFRAGRVESCTVAGDVIEGVVVGTERYHVRVAIRNQRVVAGCSCPVGVGCKHVVALVLAYLDRAPAERSGAPAGLVETREELAAWAKQRGVEHALHLSASVLLPVLSTAINPHSLSGLALRDTGAWAVIRRYVPYSANVLAAATLARLEDEAARVAEAIAEERVPRTPAVATDLTLVRLWSWLTEERGEIRAHASPRPRAWRDAQAWAFDRRERRVTWRERESFTYGTNRSAEAVLSSERDRLVVTCPCMLSAIRSGARCAHVLALVDATLDVLADPARTAEAAQLARELLRPSWSRALVELAFEGSGDVQAPVAIEVWWQIEDELRVPTLTPIIRKQTKRGLSNGARIASERLLDQHAERLEPRDRAIAEAVVAWDADLRHAGSYPMRAFAAAVGHPRLLSEDGEPVALVRAELGVMPVATDDVLRLELAVDGEPLGPELAATAMTSIGRGEPLLVEERDRRRFVLIEIGDATRRVWNVIARHGAEFPPESHGELLAQLAQLQTKVPVTIPERLKGEAVAAAPRVVIRLRLLGDTLELEPHIRPAPGAPLYAPGVGPRDVIFARDGKRAYVRRGLGAEPARARDALDRWLRTVGDPATIASEGPPGCFQIAELDHALALVTHLDQTPPDFDAEWVSEPPIVDQPFGPKALRVTVEHDRDWFGIVGDLKIESGRVELAVLLDAARRQRRYVRVGERRWIELSDVLRDRLRAIADQTFVGKRRLELSPGAVPAVAALAAAGVEVVQAPGWQHLTDRLATATRLRPRPPPTLVATLRDYQIEGHAWLSRVAAWGAGACLADDMGLGKTVQAIALLLDRAKHGPAVVIAPTSVCFNWIDELARFAPSLRPVLYREQPDRAACLGKLGKRDVLIASYGLLVRDAAPLAATRFATLVVDEAQALKNPATRRAKAARGLDAEFRVALSGTPLENHLGELWSLFSIVFPGLLGSAEQFRERFASPIERGKDPEARAALARVIRPFLLRRTKQEVARELPPRTEIALPIALTPQELEMYEDARLAAVAELTKQKGVRDEQRRFQVLAALTRLRLLASHPRLHDPSSPVVSSKLRRLVELLEELREGGHRALVFSQFTSHLALVREELDRAGFRSLYLDGATPARKRKAIVGEFQTGDAEVFLISLKAGGTGLNLTGADYVIHLDPWWNPAVEDQASDRAHRIGQTKPVTVYRLISRGTIEEKILTMHADKRALVAGILEGTDVAARMSTRDLLALLAQGATTATDDDDREPEPTPHPTPPRGRHLRLVP